MNWQITNNGADKEPRQQLIALKTKHIKINKQIVIQVGMKTMKIGILNEMLKYTQQLLHM